MSFLSSVLQFSLFLKCFVVHMVFKTHCFKFSILMLVLPVFLDLPFHCVCTWSRFSTQLPENKKHILQHFLMIYFSWRHFLILSFVSTDISLVGAMILVNLLCATTLQVMSIFFFNLRLISRFNPIQVLVLEMKITERVHVYSPLKWVVS